MVKLAILLALVGAAALSVDSASAWNQDIYANPNWRQLPGSLKWASVWGDYIWGTNDEDDVFVGNAHGDPNWVQFQGKLTQITSNGKEICGVNAADEVFCATEGIASASPTWVQLPELLVQVDISRTGQIFGVSEPGKTWFWNQNAFSPVNTGSVVVKQIAYGSGYMCGTDTSDGVFCASGSSVFSRPAFVQVPGALRQVAVYGSRVFGVNINGEIFTMTF